MLGMEKSIDYIEKSACIDKILWEQPWPHVREKTT